ncbi:MAG: DUF167 family protein [Paracoccaceae bacterium]|nr:DUF167 family protein [Paracoccaceae bacterium]
MAARAWTQTASGLRLRVRLTPRAGRDALGGIRTDETGRSRLLAKVASPPVGGAANTALIKLVAKALGVPKSSVALVSGDAARVKTLEIAGDPDALEARLKALIA